jgi:hypothetical protein
MRTGQFGESYRARAISRHPATLSSITRACGPCRPVRTGTMVTVSRGFGTDHDRGIRPLNVTLLTLLVVATISGVGVRAGLPARAVGRRRPWGVRRACCCLPRPDPRRAGPSAARTIAEVDQLDVHRACARGDRGGLLHAVGGWPTLGYPDAAPRRCGGWGGGAVGCARGDASPKRPSPVAAIGAHRPDATASAAGHRRHRGLGGTGSSRGCRVARRIARSAREHRDGSRHAVDVRHGAQFTAAAWRLQTPDRLLDLAAIAALPQSTVRAVLDCTGGWFTEQEWRGGLGARLAGGASIEVVSTTGYRRRFLPARPGRCCWRHMPLASALSRPRRPGRTVAPGRRGFWWVKRVTSIEVWTSRGGGSRHSPCSNAVRTSTALSVLSTSAAKLKEPKQALHDVDIP